MGNTFYYEDLFNQALSGINSSGFMPSIYQIANMILLACLLFAVFEAYTRGGEVRALGIALVKYLAVGLVLANNNAVLGDLMNMANGVANYIASTAMGGTDIFAQYLSQLKTYFKALGPSPLWNGIPGVLAGILGTILIAIA